MRWKTAGMAALLGVSVVATTMTFATPFSISEAEVNRYLTQKLVKNNLLEGNLGIKGLAQIDYHTRDLRVLIGQTLEKRVEIEGNFDSHLQFGGREHQVDLFLRFNTLPYFDPEQGELYLKDVRLSGWKIQPESAANEIGLFIPFLAESIQRYLNSHPVYRLDENKMGEALLKKFGKQIVIEQGEIQLETQFF